MVTSRVKEGFALIEVLIVIALLALITALSGIVVPKYINKAFDARRKTDLYKLRNYLEVYFDNAGDYPKKLPDCGQPFMYNNLTILNAMFCDPVTRKPYAYQIKGDNWQSYRLYTTLSDKQDISISDVGCLGGCGPDCAYNYGVSSPNIGLIKCSYVCAPGGGSTGVCELYQNPDISLCPRLYGQDSTCKNECKSPKNKCQNASGKHVPY